MSQKEIPEDIQALLKLSPEYFDKMFDAFVRLWNDGSVTIETREDGIAVYTHGVSINKLEIQDFDKKDLSKQIPDVVDAAEFLLHSVKNKNLIQQTLGISKSDSDRLTIIWNRLEKEGILHEIDRKYHSSIPAMDIKSFNYEARLTMPAHFDGDMFPLLNFNFRINEGNERKFINFEMSATEMRFLIKKLQEAEKELERIQSYGKMVKKE